jgi:hypothetical protein
VVDAVDDATNGCPTNLGDGLGHRRQPRRHHGRRRRSRRLHRPATPLDLAHQVSRRLVDGYDLIVRESQLGITVRAGTCAGPARGDRLVPQTLEARQRHVAVIVASS